MQKYTAHDCIALTKLIKAGVLSVLNTYNIELNYWLISYVFYLKDMINREFLIKIQGISKWKCLNNRP